MTTGHPGGSARTRLWVRRPSRRLRGEEHRLHTCPLGLHTPCEEQPLSPPDTMPCGSSPTSSLKRGKPFNQQRLKE